MAMMIRCMKDWGNFKEGRFYTARLEDFAEVADWKTGKLVHGRRMVLKTECGLDIPIAEVTDDWEFVSEDTFAKLWKERDEKHIERTQFRWWDHFEIIIKNLFYIEVERP